MYITIMVLVIVAALLGGHAFFAWLFSETGEEPGSAEERSLAKAPRSFYNHRTWAAFRRLISKKPALLTYRRDRNGRFRKLTPTRPKPATRSVKARTSSKRRRPPARRAPMRRPNEERPSSPLP